MQPLNISTLNFLSKAAICWSFFWRGILITLASMLVGALLGGIFGFVLAITGVTKGGGATLAQAGGAALGFASGAVCFYFYVKWLLSSRLGGFRLLLVRAEDAK